MASHLDISSLLRESLREYIYTAKYCISYRKTEDQWESEQKGGCLGCSGAALLFTVADTIGSFHRGNKGFKLTVDGKCQHIMKSGPEHFRIFNSEFYGLNLTGCTIEALYEKYRNPLIHNASLTQGHSLFLGEADDEPFPLNMGKVSVNVAAFLRVSGDAVDKFLTQVDDIVPGSRQEDDINRKASDRLPRDL